MEMLQLQQLHLLLQMSQVFVIVLFVQSLLPMATSQCANNFSFKPEE